MNYLCFSHWPKLLFHEGRSPEQAVPAGIRPAPDQHGREIPTALPYDAVDLPLGLCISGTGLISGTIAYGTAADFNGSYNPTIIVANNEGGSTQTSFAWSANRNQTAPTLTNLGTQTNVAGDSVNLQISAGDPDGVDFLTYSATGLPDGLSIDPSAGTITGTIADDAVSNTPYTITVTANDGNGRSISQTFTWLVNAPAITAQTSPISAAEGNDTGSITVGTFTTADMNSQAGDFTATINWGDGNSDVGTVSGQNGSFTVTDDHTYAEMGSYPVSITIVDSVTGASATVATTATVSDAALTMTGGFQLGTLLGQSNDLTLTTFTDGNPSASVSDYTATVNWGDGSGNQAATVNDSGAGVFSIGGAHNYNQTGTYTATITVTDIDGATQTTTSTLVVGNVYAGMASNLTVASFQDSNLNVQASQFTATITWGDGTQSSGTVTGGNGVFTVQGTHTYAVDSFDQPNGVYALTVTVSDSSGNTLTSNGTVAVVRPPMTLDTGNVPTPPNSLELTNVQVEAFTLPDSVDATGEFSAVIAWGDNSSSGGMIVEVSPGLFTVVGSHTYTAAGEYAIVVTVLQGWQAQQPAAQAAGLAFVINKSIVLDGPWVVPGNSNYEYSFRPPDGATNVSLKIINDKPELAPEVQPDKAKGPGWYKVGFINGDSTYSIFLYGEYTGRDGKNYRTGGIAVTVVSILVKNPPNEKPFTTDIGPIVSELSKETTVKIGAKTPLVRMLAVTPGNKPTKVEPTDAPGIPFNLVFPDKPGGAIRFSAGVMLGARFGLPDNAEGIDQIVVGFMQHVTVQQYTVHFGPWLSITSSLVNATKNGVLDSQPASGKVPSSRPWFSNYAGASFHGGSIDQENVDAYLSSQFYNETQIDPDLEDQYFSASTSVITDSDTPVMAFPVIWGVAGATSVDIKAAFTTDVVATRESDVKSGPYFQEATSKWTMDLSGKVDAASGIWQPTDMKIITPPESWGEPQSPIESRESISGSLANDLPNTWTSKTD